MKTAIKFILFVIGEPLIVKFPTLARCFGDKFFKGILTRLCAWENSWWYNKVRHAYSRGVRKNLGWHMIGGLEPLFSLHDENCPDVCDYCRKSTRWEMSRLGSAYGLHIQSDNRCVFEKKKLDNGYRFGVDGGGEHWINLVSTCEMPRTYALEFELIPHTIFEEQCQIAFGMKDLSERHRFVIEYNKRVYYQLVHRWSFLPALHSKEICFCEHENLHIRFEKVGPVFSLIINGDLIMCERDARFSETGCYCALIFWNGDPRLVGSRPMDFEIRNFKVFSGV